jgi:hypothetical protein
MKSKRYEPNNNVKGLPVNQAIKINNGIQKSANWMEVSIAREFANWLGSRGVPKKCRSVYRIKYMTVTTASAEKDIMGSKIMPNHLM